MTQLPIQITFRNMESFRCGVPKKLMGFDELVIGTVVSFVEEAGEKGPQASTVRILTRGSEAHRR